MPKRGVERLSDKELAAILPAIMGGSPDVSKYPVGRHVYSELYLDPQTLTVTTNGATIDLTTEPYRRIEHFSFFVLVGTCAGTMDVKAQTGATLADITPAGVASEINFTATDDNKFGIIEVPASRLVSNLRLVFTLATTPSYVTGVLLVGSGYEGEFPVKAAADRLEHIVIAAKA
jgi:hypothetical protein